MAELTFVQALLPWIDEEGLMGTSPSPTKWSNGNPQLDTAIACVMEVELNGNRCDTKFLSSVQGAVLKCQNSDGSFNKNPNRPDAISHDERLAQIASARVCGFLFARMWYIFGQTHGWMMSNTGKPYWDANASVKRWERSAHLACNSVDPGFTGKALLYSWICGNADFGDVSAHRLMWVISRALKGCYNLPDAAISYWSRVMAKKYGTVGDLMSAYLYGSYFAETHPFVVYGRKLKFD